MIGENQSSPMPDNEPEQELSHQPDEIISPETPPLQVKTEEPTEEIAPVNKAVASAASNKLDTDTKLFAAISYVSGLVIIPWVTKKDNHFVSFHVKQGMALFIVEIIVWFMLWLIESFLDGVFSYHALGFIQFLYKLAWLVFGAASILGIYHALTSKEKPLPYLEVVTKNLKL